MAIFFQPLVPFLHLFMQISGGKLGLVAVKKSPLVFMFSTSGCKKSSVNSNSTEKLYLQLRRTVSMVRLTSRTAEPTALAIGLPPNVLKCDAWERVCAIFGVVTTAANGNPLPMPFAIVTEIKYNKIESFLYNLRLSFQDCLCICNLLTRWRIQQAPRTRPPVHFFSIFM